MESNPDLVSAFGANNYLAAFQHWRDIGWSEPRRTAPDGHLQLSPYIGDFTDTSYALATFSPDGLTTLAWLAISVIQEYVQHANDEKRRELEEELKRGKERVAAAQWMHDYDRSNYELEHYDRVRDTMIA